jgi:hypothetical protein
MPGLGIPQNQRALGQDEGPKALCTQDHDGKGTSIWLSKGKEVGQKKPQAPPVKGAGAKLTEFTEATLALAAGGVNAWPQRKSPGALAWGGERNAEALPVPLEVDG